MALFGKDIGVPKILVLKLFSSVGFFFVDNNHTLLCVCFNYFWHCDVGPSKGQLQAVISLS